MNTVVLDAAVFVSFESPKAHNHGKVRELVASHPRDEGFLVPSVFHPEVLAAFARRVASGKVLDTADALVSSSRFHVVPTDELLEQAAEVARTARLRAYDAVYAALSLSRGAQLMTLDGKLNARLTAAFPNARGVLP